jgi:SAM-dependent methyltransferase
VREWVVRQDGRAALREALRAPAESAFPAGEFVGQESFMPASEIRELARRAGIGPDVPVLDLCCGVAGPGRLITAETRCAYLGVDGSAEAIGLARASAGDLPCRFEQRDVPPLPEGRYAVALLLETMLAFPDKRSLCSAVASALEPNGRFGFTVEAGRALTAAERADMPDADTVWPVELPDLVRLLGEAGLTITWQRECTGTHLKTATALLQSYRAWSAEISRRIGRAALTDLIAAHELWCDWLGSGRIRKYAVVAARRPRRAAPAAEQPT